MKIETQNWNGREFTSASCTCGYKSNYTPDRKATERKAAAHAKKCKSEA